MTKETSKTNLSKYLFIFRKKALSVVFGIFISAFLLFHISKEIETEVFWSTFNKFELNSLPLVLLLTAVNVWLRVKRWVIITNIQNDFIGHKCGWTGYLLNFILPAKLGEVVKIVLASKLLKSEFENLTIKTIFDRLFDFYLIAAALLASIYLFGPGYFAVFSTQNVFLVAGLVTASLIIVFYCRDFASEMAKKALPKYSTFIANVNNSLDKTSPKSVSICFGMTLISFAIDICIAQLLLNALDLQLPHTAPFLITLFIYMSAMLPSAPGQIGLHQTAAILAMGFFHVGESIAVAYSVILQVITFLVILVVALLIWLYSFKAAKTAMEYN